MFYHAFDGYMENAFPLDELRPLSCGGEDTLGGYALTLVRQINKIIISAICTLCKFSNQVFKCLSLVLLSCHCLRLTL